jgi:hypothetical protein
MFSHSGSDSCLYALCKPTQIPSPCQPALGGCCISTYLVFAYMHNTLHIGTDSTVIQYRVRTDKKENKIFLIYKEIQSGAVAKSFMRKGFLIYEEMRKFFPIYEEAVSHI